MISVFLIQLSSILVFFTFLVMIKYSYIKLKNLLDYINNIFLLDKFDTFINRDPNT